MTRAVPVVGLLFLLSACNGGDLPGASTQPSTNLGRVSGDPAWRLDYRATCVDGTAESCGGFYGFSILNDGTYEVGPGPTQESLTGRLDPVEVQVFRQFLGKLMTENFEISSFSPNQCIQDEMGPVGTVQLGYRQLNHVIARASDSELCFERGFVRSQADAQAIETWMAAMSLKYYSNPFPSLSQ